MILSQVLYNKGNVKESVIILILGREGDKIFCIRDDKIDKKDAETIKRNAAKLSRYNMPAKITWLKSHVPNAYKNGFRKLTVSKIEVQQSYSLINDKQTHTNL
jgi:hypothetical protein